MIWALGVEFANPQNPEFRDLFVGFTELPFNSTILAGHQKRPLGLEVMNSSRYNTFIERALSSDAFNEDQRRLGVCLYGYTDNEMIGWAAGAFSLDNTFKQDGDISGDSFQMTINNRLWASPWYDAASEGRGYLHLGVSNMLADPWEASVAQPDNSVLVGNLQTNPADNGTLLYPARRSRLPQRRPPPRHRHHRQCLLV